MKTSLFQNKKYKDNPVKHKINTDLKRSRLRVVKTREKSNTLLDGGGAAVEIPHKVRQLCDQA